MIDILKPLIKQFMPFAQKKMGFDRPPKLFLKQDKENASNPLGKTGFYDPAAESITIFTSGRHPKDVMRSLSHELMHHAQNCKGEFKEVTNMGEQGYAQNDSHMRTMEIQAYQASIVFRDWEDSIKGTIYNESLQKGANENMSTKNWKNNELKTLLTEKWGFGMDLSKLNESNWAARLRNEEAIDFLEKTQNVDDDQVISWLDRGRPLLDYLHGDLHLQVAERVQALEARIPEDSPHRPGSSKQLNEVRTEHDGSDPGTRPKGPYLSDPSPCGEGEERDPITGKCEAPKAGTLGEAELFEEATAICKRRHDIQGDKAVRACIEETMTKNLYEMCPDGPHQHGEDEGGGMEIEMPMGGGEMDVEMIGGEEEGGLKMVGGGEEGLEGIESKLDQIIGLLAGEEDEGELEERSKRKDDPRNRRAKEWPDRMRENLEGEGSEGIVDKLKKLPAGAWEMIEGILEAMADQGDPRKPSEWSDEEWKEFITTGPGSTPGYWVPEDPSGARFESRMRESLKKKFGNNAITEKQARLIIRRALELHYGTKR